MKFPLLLLLGCVPPAIVHAAPDRAAFAKEDRPVEGVPVEAFELADDSLKLEVWAQSPLIYSPVAMDTDALGRLWVTEGIDYNAKPRIDAGQSIIVVEDKDGDGRAESSHVFVTEKMRPAPLGIAVFDNRIVLSATPSVIVYTDVNRNAVFDPGIDQREVFLTGFQNPAHDHTLHAVVGAPSGQWHFSMGNCGADVRTKDGRHFVSGCYYGYPQGIGQASSDGHIYKGGCTLRINPDGTGLAVTGENMRNPHDMAVSAFGDVFQSDNDDPAHCRSSWVMEYGNMGYADLKDGSRSWEEVAKTWEEPSGWSRDLRFSRSHWRENYPGACLPGTIYGAGSPTGNVLIEDNTLGLAGTYLVGCMVRKEVMACRPALDGAAVSMGKHQPFLRLKKEERGRYFLPTDLLRGTDGSLFLTDFYNDTSRRTNQVSGTIYRLTKKDAAPLVKPVIDFTTTAGQLAALRSPAVNIRSHAAALLVAGKDHQAVAASLETVKDSAVLTARHLWILAQQGDAGRVLVLPWLDQADPQLVITAYRALRHAAGQAPLDLAARLAASNSPAIRREVALSLRDVPYAQSAEMLTTLTEGYDGLDRYYLEALGIAYTGKENEAWKALSGKLGDPAGWGRRAKHLAWRLGTPEAIASLDACLRAQVPPIDEFRRLGMAFAVFRNEAERVDRLARLEALAALPAFAREDYQTTVSEIIAKDLNDLKGEGLTESWPVPETLGEKTNVSAPEVIAALPGDAAAGKLQSTRCLICHRIGGEGVHFGPELTQWGAQRTIQEIVKEITDPDAKLAHGYDQPVRLKSGPHLAEGLMTNYSYHAGSLKLKVMGGVTKKILFRSKGVEVENLKTSPMPSASEMGLTDQDVRNVAEYLKNLEPAQLVAAKAPETLPPDGTTEGWEVLTGEDFVKVNCRPDTWRWEGGHVFCTGNPVGVIRYREPLGDFELLCEWMHKQKGGNSGVFVWATPQSIANLTAGQGRLPHGIEVQVLDLGYAEVYTKQTGKPADWFTSHGDVFPVGPVKMRPFPPVAPDGQRSFPTQHTTKGTNEWNHYYIRAVGGEVKLWVNGVQVSGGDNISPASGYLCLESEGAPVEFRNLRLRRHSPAPALPLPEPTPPPPPAPAAVKLDGHPALGRWYYGSNSREVTADGYVTLREGDNIIWKRGCLSKTADGFVLEGDLTHELKGDVLHIEGRYQAKRK